MKVTLVQGRSCPIALVESQTPVITDVRSALDVMMEAKYTTGAERLVMDKRAFADNFFILSSGLAGEILQKFINYHMKVAIFGDFTVYTSKPLKDFIYESNQGRDVFFLPTCEEACQRLETV